jgi:hypothetical protein
MAVAYHETPHGRFQGPLPTAFTLNATGLTVRFDDGQPIELRTHDNFDVRSCLD